MIFEEWYQETIAQKDIDTMGIHSGQIFYTLCRMAWYAALDSEEVALLKKNANRYLTIRKAALESEFYGDEPPVTEELFDLSVDEVSKAKLEDEQ